MISEATTGLAAAASMLSCASTHSSAGAASPLASKEAMIALGTPRRSMILWRGLRNAASRTDSGKVLVNQLLFKAFSDTRKLADHCVVIRRDGPLVACDCFVKTTTVSAQYDSSELILNSPSR
jgi:hypothetical protein